MAWQNNESNNSTKKKLSSDHKRWSREEAATEFFWCHIDRIITLMCQKHMGVGRSPVSEEGSWGSAVPAPKWLNLDWTPPPSTVTWTIILLYWDVWRMKGMVDAKARAILIKILNTKPRSLYLFSSLLHIGDSAWWLSWHLMSSCELEPDCKLTASDICPNHMGKGWECFFCLFQFLTQPHACLCSYNIRNFAHS